jgi:putative methyltransferase (TIGR04325 family)
MVSEDFKVWDGVYASFAEAPDSGPGFASPTWQERSVRYARDAMARLAQGEPLEYSMRQRNAILSFTVAMLLSRTPRPRVIDLGGGLGAGYLVTSGVVGSKITQVDYLIAEVDVICRVGRDLYAGRAGPKFTEGLPDSGDFDIVHACSVMQYIEDWRGMVRRLAGYGAAYLSIGDAFIGDFPAYVTLQNDYESRTRHWFFNAAEFIGEVEACGYELVLRAPCDVKVLGAYGALPMGHFPPALQIRHTANLLFTKSRA